ncbi:hypothetical protein ABIF26_006495 [Bradyrhizobium elkanii]|uniref:hypothetical protein n=1 Tax=Bradyrhizobium elkanii TaxID=29448 RepID=UPI003511CEB9
MTKLERELLESIAGLRTHHEDGREIKWGAWMSACLESLEGSGYVQADHRAKGYTYEVTPRGFALLAQSNGSRG